MSERVWMITGASRGIGAEIAKAVLASGDKLVATARTLKGLEHLEPSEKLLSTVLDVGDERQAIEAVEAGAARFGHIDVVVNNAGICLVGAVEETSAEEVERLYRTNVFGLLNVTRAVLPGMRQRRSGHIINISSVAGYSGYMGFGVYSSTKFAVEGLSEALHLELAPLGIHVTVVEPGFFRSDILDHSKSLFEAPIRYADYDGTAGAVRALYRDTVITSLAILSSSPVLCWSLQISKLRLCDYRWDPTHCSGWRKKMRSSSEKPLLGGLWPHQPTTEATDRQSMSFRLRCPGSLGAPFYQMSQSCGVQDTGAKQIGFVAAKSI